MNGVLLPCPNTLSGCSATKARACCPPRLCPTHHTRDTHTLHNYTQENPYIKMWADALAEAGFHVVVPDLVRGKIWPYKTLDSSNWMVGQSATSLPSLSPCSTPLTSCLPLYCSTLKTGCLGSQRMTFSETATQPCCL